MSPQSLGRRLIHRDTTRYESAIEHKGVAEKTQVVIVNDRITVHGLIASIVLVTEYDQSHVRAIFLIECQGLTKNCAHDDLLFERVNNI
jgi:hypothetical protein